MLISETLAVFKMQSVTALTLSLVFVLSRCEPGPLLIEVDSSPGINLLLTLHDGGLVDFWGRKNSKALFLVERSDLQIVEGFLRDQGLEFKIVVEDVLDLVEKEKQHMQKTRAKRAIKQMDWSSYHSLEDIEGYLGWLNATHSKLVTVIPLTQTEEGRFLYVVKVSDPSAAGPKKKIWIEGGIHAREWISPSAATFLLHEVVTNPEFRPLLDRAEWYFVPVSNPDGYDYTFKGGRARLWRKNRRHVNSLLPNHCQGVDLNRNWDLKWGVGASSNPCSDTFKGYSPFSEPETNAMQRFMRQEAPFDLFITFHSFGQSILYPWGWTRNPPKNVKELHRFGRRFVDAVKHASRGETSYVLGGSGEVYGLASGATDDWAFGALGTPLAYTIELRDQGEYGFLLPESQIQDTVQETATGLYCMASYLTNTGVCARKESGEKDLQQSEYVPQPRQTAMDGFSFNPFHILLRPTFRFFK